MPMPDWTQDFDRDGCAVVPDVLNSDEVDDLIKAVGRALSGPTTLKKNDSAYGMRDLLARVPEVAALARSAPMLALVAPVLGPAAVVVRGLWFDKSPGANWDLPWHRDLTIAVRERIETPGFRAWTIKAGIHHVLPPLEVLRGMMTVRLHLDDVDEENGPLEVLPGSHLADEEALDAIDEWRRRVAPKVCLVSRGGAVLMRPLLLHASGSAKVPGHRRTIHLEYAAGPLPGGLQWQTDQVEERSP